MEPKIGDVRVRTLIHPDSVGVRIWEVEMLMPARGKYAKAGDTYWLNVREGVEPYTCEAEALARKASMEATWRRHMRKAEYSILRMNRVFK